MLRTASGIVRLRTTVGAVSVGLAALAAANRPAQGQTFSLGANFTSMTYTQSTGEPPDTMAAVGPNYFVVSQNDGFSIFNKRGVLVSSESPATFWTSALGSNPGGLTDPRILYDPASQRWFAVMVTTDQSTNNKILFARSNTADPTQGFKGVSYTTNNNRFADFPTLGLDANGVYVGTNNFSGGGSFRSEGLYSVPKADLLAATPTLTHLTAFSSLGASTVGFTLQAAVNYGPKQPTDSEIILANNLTSSTRFNFTPLTGTSGPGATLGSTTLKTVQSTSNPTNSAQPGSSNTIDNGDDSFSSNVVQIGNFLYAVNSTAVSGRTAVRWTIADATSFNILQQGTISDPALSFFYPSVAVNAAGDVVVGFSGSNSSTYASTYAVVGTSAGGVAGGSLTFGTPVQTKSGSTYYDGDRWGDFSATTPDPADPGIFWTNQEYATTRQFSGTNWNWATEATEIIPTKAGERRWSNTAGGSFAAGGNYFTGAMPVATDHVIFSRPSASYTVTFSGSSVSDRASVRQGNVTWDLAGGSYTLSNSSTGTSSLTVGEFQGTAALAISGGALNTVNATIGGTAVGSGALTVNADTTWTNSSSLVVGAAGAGTLTTQGQGTVYVGTNLSIRQFGTVNLNGGTLRFDGYTRAPGGTVNFTSGKVQVAGNRTIDSDAAIADFFGAPPTIGADKQLTVEGIATLSAAAPVTLAGGTLAAVTGLTLNAGGNIAGHGTVDTPNNATTPLINNGTINGISLAEPLTLPGFVTGIGSLDNVHFTGKYSPGIGPTSASLGSAEYAGTLEIEIGGLTAGNEYDQLNHTLGNAVAQLGGTLNVSLLNDFMPQAGDMFDILTATGTLTGTFASTILPTLSGNLFWNINYGANSVELSVAAPSLDGDFNGDGVVDAADYVVWRKGLGSVYTIGDYDVWRASFGQMGGSGGSLAALPLNSAVPEPATVALLILGWFVAAPFCRRGS